MKLPFDFFNGTYSQSEVHTRVELVRNEVRHFANACEKIVTFSGVSIPVDAAVLAVLLLRAHRDEPSSTETDG